MARTTLTPIFAPRTAPLAAEPLAWTQADATNGNQFAYTGREILLVWNTSGTDARHIAFQSVAVNGRLDPSHNTNIAIAIGGYAVFGPFGEGWKQSDGYVYVDCDSTDIRLAVLRY